MNNAEWIVEHKPELFDLFDCPQCSKYNGEKCTRPDELDFDRRECAKGHVAWLLQPYESSLEAAQTGDSDKDECEPAETENAAQSDADSREKIESDCNRLILKIQKRTFSGRDATALRCQLHDLLDRQAKITEREREQHWLEIIGASANANLELTSQIAELKERRCPGYEPESHRCKWHDADFELNADRLNDLKRENAGLKRRIAELEEHHRWIAEETVSARELELKEERDYWRGQFRACLGAAAKDGYALGLLRYPRPDNLIEPFLVVTNCLDELRDQLADERRTHAENAAETHDFAEDPQKTPEQQHICDTCRWFVRVGDGTGDCHRWPREVEKWPDDWCGEWSK